MPAFRHFLSWSLISALLVGQTGVSLHQIYCFCKGEWEARLWEVEEAGCSAHSQAGTQSLPDCCSKKTHCKSPSAYDTSSDLPCKEDQTVYLKLDKPAIPVKDSGYAFMAPLLADEASAPDFNPIPPFQALRNPETSFRAPPGQANGQEIKIWVQSFRC